MKLWQFLENMIYFHLLPGSTFVHTKVSYFFFPEKFVAHSLTRFWEILLFFFAIAKKKNVFFFWEKFTCHSLDKKIYVSKKRSKKGKICSFSIFDSVFFVFFSFPKNLEKFFVFFLWKSLHPTHSLDFKTGEKKKQGRKKKNSIFTHWLDFCQKVVKIKLFRGKKNTIPLVVWGVCEVCVVWGVCEVCGSLTPLCHFKDK